MGGRGRLGALLLVGVIVAGCETEASSASDAAVDAAADAGSGLVPIMPTPPASPAPPVLTPCPPSFTERARADGIVVCEPFASGSPDACADGFVHLPGEPACRRLGTECAADGVPTGLPAGAAVLYVRAGATTGDGTLAQPFATITEALAVATDGSIVAIAPGTYDEALRLDRPVTLWGACPSSVLLTSSVPDGAVRAGVVTAASAGVVVRNLSVGESARPGIWAAGATVELELQDVIVRGADRVGIEAETGAHVTADGLVVRDTKPGPTGQFGRGVGVQSASRVELRRALIERNREFGATALNPGSMLVLEDAVVRDGLPRMSNGGDGLGVAVIRGGAARLARVLVSGNTSGGVSALDPGSTIELLDVTIRDSRPQALDGRFGRGLNAELGAAMTARRVVVERSYEIGVFADSPGTTLLLEDVIVSETRPRETDGLAGRGLDVQHGAVADVRRIVIEDSTEAGLIVGEGGAVLRLEDAVIRRSTPGVDMVGRGINVQTDAMLVASRVHIDESHGVAILVSGEGAVLELADARLSRTRGLTEVAPARGVCLQLGGVADLSRVALEDTAQYGLTAEHSGTRLTLTDVLVTGTTSVTCTGRGCLAGGTALGAYSGSAITATRFVMRLASQCGVQVSTRGELDLHEGEVSQCVIGACVGNEGYDFARLSNAVRYHDNERSLDTSILPVPTSLPSLTFD